MRSRRTLIVIRGRAGGRAGEYCQVEEMREYAIVAFASPAAELQVDRILTALCTAWPDG